MRLKASLATIAAILLVAASAAAQTDMRYYIVPRVVDTGILGVHPKYVERDALGPGWNVGQWSAMDYGLENVFIVHLHDAGSGKLQAVGAQAVTVQRNRLSIIATSPVLPPERPRFSAALTAASKAIGLKTPACSQSSCRASKRAARVR